MGFDILCTRSVAFLPLSSDRLRREKLRLSPGFFLRGGQEAVQSGSPSLPPPAAPARIGKGGASLPRPPPPQAGLREQGAAVRLGWRAAFRGERDPSTMTGPRGLALLLLLLLLRLLGGRTERTRQAPGINSAGKPTSSFSHREELTSSTFLRRKTGPSRYPTPESLKQMPEESLDALAPKLALPSKGASLGPTARPTPPARKKQENQRLKLATNPRPFVESRQPPEDLGEGLPASLDEKPTMPVGDGRESSLAVTSHSSFQISPFTVLPATQGPSTSPRGVTETLEKEAVILPNSPPESAEDEVVKGGSSSREEGQEATSAIVSPPEQLPSLCSMNFSEPEGYIDSAEAPLVSQNDFLECTFRVTVYTGYGVELQVKSVNLSEGEVLAIRGEDDGHLVTLANQTLLVEGQVIRSPTNTISVLFRAFPDGLGTFQLHYQIFMLSCSFPRRPNFGEVAVMGLHSGGLAHFNCHLGYELEGPQSLTCLNASKPHWSALEPICSAPCGGTVRNATIGRILAPTSPRSPSGSVACVWMVSAPEGQKLHLHFERLVLGGKQRMVVYGGESNRSAVLYDSQQGSNVPFEGVISEGNALRVDFTSDDPDGEPTFNIRFEAFEKGHCYEPHLQNGNFTTSDATYNLGAIVEFTCDPGHSLEQGPAVIECINLRDPYWNDTEPLCQATCGGELSTAAGVILSPNWPEPYAEGEDCIWKVHVEEEKRIFLDIQLLNLSQSDILTVYDGDDLNSHILGQFLGSSGPQKLYSSTPDLTIQFHSDPAGLIFGKGQGFTMSYIEASRNESCSDLPEIQNGWKTTSHTELVREAKITYQCDPGYDIVGSDTLTCQWDLTWSSDPPFCEKIMYCTDPGEVEHSTRLISDPVLLVGTTIQYTCNLGFVLEGSSLLTCYSRETGTPIWTSRLPRCVPEESLACDNPGLPENGYQILYKRLYLPGESLTFMCYEGFELLGELTLKCILGQPSRWSGPLPTCKVNQDSFEHALEVAEAAAETSLEGGNMALAIFIPVLVVSLLLGGAYVYITRCRYYSSLRLPLMYSHPYSQITVETEFDNPIYETGETREYEVSI
ncbi:seizure 6-like protein isoform X1 [Pantherophis guttatus]|uniref:Seizure 6-like protein isoform X1 n=2 Tax=Pantherophis guttatus TaxID=94885 RepID=A0ABM3YPU6_PANGU|nr:seizure 6-like protein isoform X1 [Pantherophis guttatus]